MTAPGGRLIAIASRWCRADTMARVVEPLVADMQAEYADAITRGQQWRARWIRGAAAVSLIKVLMLSFGADLRAWALEWPDADRRGLRRLVLVACAVGAAFGTVALVSQLTSPGLATHPSRLHLLTLLMPQALPVAAPWGLTFGILYGLAGTLGSRLRTAALTLAFVASIALWVWVGWVVPPANQAFRVAASGMPNIGRGSMELTRPDLKQRIASLERELLPAARQARIVYARRDALPWATLSLAVFTVAIAPKRRWPGWTLAMLACALPISYWGLNDLGYAATRNNTLAVWLGAWLANLTFVAAAALVSGPALIRRVSARKP